MKICFATNNPNKLKEIRNSVPSEIEIVSLSDIGCNEELPETQDTLSGNSLQKAKYVWDNYGVACFADDTGLEVAALNREPGVYSARYAGPQRNANDNMDLVLKNLEGKPNRSASFITVITLISHSEKIQFVGEAKGSILTQRSGTQGFGYDPIFQPDGFDITFAEMDMHQKNKISHRGKAVVQLVDYLNSLEVN